MDHYHFILPEARTVAVWRMGQETHFGCKGKAGGVWAYLGWGIAYV